MIPDANILIFFSKIQIFTWRHKWDDYFEIAQVGESHPHGGDIRGTDSDIEQPDHSPGTGMKQHYILEGFQFEWLKIEEIYAAFPISIALFSDHLK